MSTDTLYSGPALHTAIHSNDEAQFKKLVASSSNFNIQDNEGDNIVHIAVRRDRQGMLTQLAEAGADLNTINNKNETPLEIAFRNNNADMVKLLVAQGADINGRFKDGSTLLHNIVKTANKLELLEFALNAGAKTATQDRRGNTPLHYALQLAHTTPQSSKEYTKIAKILIEKETNPAVFHQINLLRKPPYAIALKSGNKEILTAIEAKISNLIPELSNIKNALKTPLEARNIAATTNSNSYNTTLTR